MNILLVDDDQVDRYLIIRTLKKSNLNANITEAVTVEEGMRYYKENSFDIVLLDYRMPQQDGIEMVVAIRNAPNNPGVAIVMMSASEDEDLALQCIRAGAQDFLAKSEISDKSLRRAILHASVRFDLEKKLYEAYQRVKQLAETDPLTGLANRYLFDESLKQAMSSNERSDSQLALLLIDIDNFKLINDNFGHDVGDMLLNRVVVRVKSCLRGSEIFSRLGGDEFAVLLSNLPSPDSASLVARRILKVLEKTIEINSLSIRVSASIGIALHPDDGNTSEEVFKFADIAMYRAKKLGKNRVCFFEEEMQQHFYSRLKIEMELREALEKQQMQLYYQPVIDLGTNKVMGFEALLRWGINGEIRSPDTFINIAEETHQIEDVGSWVIEQAIGTLAKWNHKRKKPLRMAINISAIQVSSLEIVEKIASCLNRYQVAPSLIDIELTETALLIENKVTSHVIAGLSELGVCLALDDFGTGFSSVAHLRNYPIDVVKIDKSLMPKDQDDNKNSALVEGLVSMSTILGLNVVAEGVETEHQLKLCRRLRIGRVQGYYYSRPLAEQEIEQQYLG